jgi:RNA polymerase sigma-70 factor (ECF subfamily)
MKEKDKTALFNQLYQENKELIFRLCRSFLSPGQDTEDLFQEIFLKVWDNLESFRGQSQISTWVYRIGTNTALLYRKRTTRRKDKELVTNTDYTQRIIADSSGLEEKIVHHQQFKELLSLISAMDEMDRIIITMLLEGFSYKEIADVSGLKVNNVGVKISRIKKQLKKKIKVS